MNAISLQNVKKHFRKQTVRREYTSFKTELVRMLTFQRKWFAPAAHIEALKGIDLVVPRGKTVGLVGRNGSGKSTLLKLITGIYTPSSGKMEVNGRISALLDLGAGFHPDFTGRENIVINGVILGMTRAQVKARMDEIIAFAELGDFIDEPVRTYSSGMYMRLAFAVATHVDPEILIVDEILAVGDEHFSRKSLAKMNEFKSAGKTILLVTHDLSTVQSWCDLAAWIDGGRIRMFGKPSEVVSQYREAVALAEKQAEDTGVSALSAPGVALPELKPAQVEAVAPKTVDITAVEFEHGAPRLSAHTPTGLKISLNCHSGDKAWKLSARLLSDDGTVFFSSNPLEAPPGSGPWVVTLQVPALGLRAGKYRLSATVTDAAGAQLSEHVIRDVDIENSLGGEGLIQLPVEWKVAQREPPVASAAS